MAAESYASRRRTLLSVTYVYYTFSIHSTAFTNSSLDRHHDHALRTSTSLLTRVNENFAVWESSSVRRSQSTRCEPASQDLLSLLNFIARKSRCDTRQFLSRVCANLRVKEKCFGHKKPVTFFSKTTVRKVLIKVDDINFHENPFRQFVALTALSASQRARIYSHV